MQMFSNVPVAGLVVIAAIILLFIVGVVMLITLTLRYRSLTRQCSGLEKEGKFVRALEGDYTAAYEMYGKDTNTPAIIENAVHSRLAGSLICERFIANSVSLFVTLGLFGTFLGLTLSVTSLTELISLSNSSEWLSVLNSVGGGLISALSGMGVAFYTSLVGAGCAILFTVCRSVLNPEELREKMCTAAELWLDHAVADSLPKTYENGGQSDIDRVGKALLTSAETMEKALEKAVTHYERAMSRTARDFTELLENSKEPLEAFCDTVGRFSDNCRDFGEINYELRGTVERMDVAIRDLSSALQRSRRELEEGSRK